MCEKRGRMVSRGDDDDAFYAVCLGRKLLGRGFF